MSSRENDKLEKLTTFIQNSLKDNPALLIGSGVSVPYGLPSMQDLAEEIIQKNKGKYKGNKKWEDFEIELHKGASLEDALDLIDFGEQIHADIIWSVWEFIVERENEALIKFIMKKELPILSKFLGKLLQTTDPTNIITTNYDRLIEYACDIAGGRVNNGFSGFHIRKFSNFKEYYPNRAIDLLKVHGSIDWFRHRKDKDIVSLPLYDRDLLFSEYDPLIVTPGYKKFKETHNDPFRTVITKADDALRKSQSYLCLGYGFNDEHIQPIILEENRTKSKPIIIVTKTITTKIRDIFVDGTVMNCLILSEDDKGGTKVIYSPKDSEYFSENYWHLDEFYNLWF